MSTPIVELRAVQKIYSLGSQKLHVLKSLDLEVPPNDYVAIMGPSGSGKSTLLNILGLLDVPDSGEYRLAGEPVGHLRDKQLARVRNTQIGFVFQSFNLFRQMTVRQNIEVPMAYLGLRPRERRKRAVELATRVGLGDRLKHKPRHLSGGEQQRVAIARALANRPPLLLADEPTGNLDERTGEEILKLFDELLAEGQTIVLVTHNPQYRSRVKRTLDMLDGRFAARPVLAAG